jgi:ribosomal protein S18 acetylase RimI-like enzyme
MKPTIRIANDGDINAFVNLSLKLSMFNRENHRDECKTDDYTQVQQAIRQRAESIFKERDTNILILIATKEEKVCGYALARIVSGEPYEDNGTGAMGLFDELYIDDSLRGMGLGQRMIDEVMNWMKQKSISRVKLHAYSWNTNAREIYQKNGFREYAVSFEKFI